MIVEARCKCFCRFKGLKTSVHTGQGNSSSVVLLHQKYSLYYMQWDVACLLFEGEVFENTPAVSSSRQGDFCLYWMDPGCFERTWWGEGGGGERFSWQGFQ